MQGSYLSTRGVRSDPCGDIDGFNALIAGGADITIKDDDGKTALFYAEHLKGSSMLPDNEYNKIIHLLSMDNGTK